MIGDGATSLRGGIRVTDGSNIRFPAKAASHRGSLSLFGWHLSLRTSASTVRELESTDESDNIRRLMV